MSPIDALEAKRRFAITSPRFCSAASQSWASGLMTQRLRRENQTLTKGARRLNPADETLEALDT
jgi:hypothetical protein